MRRIFLINTCSRDLESIVECFWPDIPAILLTRTERKEPDQLSELADLHLTIDRSEKKLRVLIKSFS